MNPAAFRCGRRLLSALKVFMRISAENAALLVYVRKTTYPFRGASGADVPAFAEGHGGSAVALVEAERSARTVNLLRLPEAKTRRSNRETRAEQNQRGRFWSGFHVLFDRRFGRRFSRRFGHST